MLVITFKIYLKVRINRERERKEEVRKEAEGKETEFSMCSGSFSKWL